MWSAVKEYYFWKVQSTVSPPVPLLTFLPAPNTSSIAPLRKILSLSALFLRKGMYEAGVRIIIRSGADRPGVLSGGGVRCKALRGVPVFGAVLAVSKAVLYSTTRIKESYWMVMWDTST